VIWRVRIFRFEEKLIMPLFVEGFQNFKASGKKSELSLGSCILSSRMSLSKFIESTRETDWSTFFCVTLSLSFLGIMIIFGSSLFRTPEKINRSTCWFKIYLIYSNDRSFKIFCTSFSSVEFIFVLPMRHQKLKWTDFLFK